MYGTWNFNEVSIEQAIENSTAYKIPNINKLLVKNLNHPNVFNQVCIV